MKRRQVPLHGLMQYLTTHHTYTHTLHNTHHFRHTHPTTCIIVPRFHQIDYAARCRWLFRQPFFMSIGIKHATSVVSVSESQLFSIQANKAYPTQAAAAPVGDLLPASLIHERAAAAGASHRTKRGVRLLPYPLFQWSRLFFLGISCVSVCTPDTRPESSESPFPWVFLPPKKV